MAKECLFSGFLFFYDVFLALIYERVRYNIILFRLFTNKMI